MFFFPRCSCICFCINMALNCSNAPSVTSTPCVCVCCGCVCSCVRTVRVCVGVRLRVRVHAFVRARVRARAQPGMEEMGEAEMVHVSKTTYLRSKDGPNLQFEERGKIMVHGTRPSARGRRRVCLCLGVTTTGEEERVAVHLSLRPAPSTAPPCGSLNNHSQCAWLHECVCVLLACFGGVFLLYDGDQQ